MSTSSSGSTAHAEEFRSELELLAPGAVRTPTSSDAVDGVLPTCVAAPPDEQKLSKVLHWTNQRGLHVLPRGGGSKLGWGNVPESIDLLLSTESLNQRIEHAWQDMTVTVSAGVTVAALQNELAKQGQRLPVDALWPERATVGGVIATSYAPPRTYGLRASVKF